MSAQMLIDGGQTRETGFIGDIINAGMGIADMVNGGPQKRERAAKAELETARLNAETAATQLALSQMPPQSGGGGGGVGGVMAHKTFGVPTVALVAAAGLAAYLLTRSKK